jgi:hypothetical protein
MHTSRPLASNPSSQRNTLLSSPNHQVEIPRRSTLHNTQEHNIVSNISSPVQGRRYSSSAFIAVIHHSIPTDSYQRSATTIPRHSIKDPNRIYKTHSIDTHEIRQVSTPSRDQPASTTQQSCLHNSSSSCNRAKSAIMPARLSAPILTVDVGLIHKVDTRNVENLFSMWAGELHRTRYLGTWILTPL